MNDTTLYNFQKIAENKSCLDTLPSIGLNYLSSDQELLSILTNQELRILRFTFFCFLSWTNKKLRIQTKRN